MNKLCRTCKKSILDTSYNKSKIYCSDKCKPGRIKYLEKNRLFKEKGSHIIKKISKIINKKYKKRNTLNHPWRRQILKDVQEVIFKQGGFAYLVWHKKHYLKILEKNKIVDK